MNMGMESPWTIRFDGNPQVFAKDDVNNVYGVAVLRNIFWPGWTTIGYVLSNLYRKMDSLTFMSEMGSNSFSHLGTTILMEI